MLVYQRDGPRTVDLGMHQALAHRLERIWGDENANRLAPLVFDRNRNRDDQLIGSNSGVVTLGFVRFPVLSHAFVPIAVGEIAIEYGWRGWVDRPHRSIEFVCADKSEVRTQAAGLLKVPFDSVQIAFFPCLQEFPAGCNRLQERGALTESFLDQSG